MSNIVKEKYKCTNCENEETILCIQSGYANIYPEGKVFTFKCEKLYHVICLKCGTVIKSFVKNPQKLVVK